jgi:hypothetical protein
MTSHHTLGAAAVAAALILLAACSGEPEADATDEVPTAPSPAEPSPTPAPGEVTPLPHDVEFADLAAGRYALSLDEDWSYEIDVPAGWRGFDGKWLSTQTDELEGPIFLADVVAPDATTVPAHPCDDHTPRLVGPTVKDFVAAIERLPLLRVDDPRKVTVGGASGLVMDVRSARGLDIGACADGLTLYTSGADSLTWDDAYLGRWWVIAVDGTRVVFTANCAPSECDAAMLQAAEEMVGSISFTSDE